MKKNRFIILALAVQLAASSIAHDSLAASISARLSGKILLDVERNGEAWYVYPKDLKRYYLGRPADAFKVMRELGLGISTANIRKIAAADGKFTAALSDGVAATSSTGADIGLAKSLSGRIVLEVEKKGEAWYVYPGDLKRYYLGRPTDAFRVMRELGLGISRQDLAFVHKPGFDESINKYSSYEHRTVAIATSSAVTGGEYTVDLIKIDLNNPKLKIITDTANDANCKTGCQAKPLIDYIADNKAFAGINGTYFCSSKSCGAVNYYFYPVFNSRLGKLINDDQLKYWTTGPIIAFDTNNKFYYFKDSREFKSVENFEKTYGVKLQAAMGNKPRLVEEGMNVLIEWDMDDKQMKQKLVRNAIGYKDGVLYLAIARSATVQELAEIMKALGVQYALNLDGGYSNALFYNDEYMVGPGRNIPNAIVFSES